MIDKNLSNSNLIGITQKQRWLRFVPLISLSGITCLLIASQSFAAIPQQIPVKIAQQPVNSDAAKQVLQEGVQLAEQGTAESLRQAILKFEQAALLSRQAGDKALEADTLNNIAIVYNSLGELQKALEYLNQALPLFQAVDDKRGEATILTGIGYIYSDLGENQKALDYYNQALPLRRAVGDKGGEAYTLNNIAGVYSDLGEKQKALEFFNQALRLIRAVGDKRGEATILTGIGKVYSDLGENQKALDFYNQALPLIRAVGDRGKEAFALNNIASVYDELGEKQKALDFYNQALRLIRAVGDKRGEATILNGIGNIYNLLGELQKALDFYNQALPLRRAVGDRSGEANTLNGIGAVYDDLGERQKALDFYNQALSLIQAVGDKRGEAYIFNNIASVYNSLGEKQKTLEYLNQALPLYKVVKDKRGEATALNNIGYIYNSLGEKQKALEFYNQALPLFREVGYRGGEVTTLSNLALWQRTQGNLKEALTLIENSITIIEDLRTKIGSQDQRQSYFATVQDEYEFYIDLLMQLHQQNPNQGYDALALHASERARARSLVELLTEANANIRQGVDPKLLEQEQNLLQQLNVLEHQKYRLVSGSFSQPELDEIKQKIDSTLTQLDQVKAQIRVSSPQYADLKYPEPLTVQEIQQQVLDQETVLLEYAFGDEQSYLWVVTKNSLNSYILPARNEITAAAETYLEAVTQDSTAKIEIGLPLSQMLLEPVISQLENKRLLIVGDGILQTIPFAALPLPNSVNTPLLAQNEIVTLPSASTVSIQRRQLENRSLAAKTLAVLADPVFQLEDERIAGTLGQQSTSSSNNADRSLATRSGLGFNNLPPNLSRLEYTRTEAEKILSLVPESQRLQAFDFEASRQFAKDPSLAQSQIIHLATHGLLNKDYPELSGVVLSLFDKTRQPQDGFLRLNDIFNLNWPAELVVLSACQTGLGEEVRGEGLVGLTRGFMYAGARRVIVSLWSVNDSATSELMSEFYQKMLNEKQEPVSALREAQLEMWNAGKSPYYWAAFTVQGDWR